MNILIMGPAGVGKGTVSQRIVEEFHVAHISTGDMFRAAIKNNTELGRQAKSYMEKGLLVPDEITINMTKERIMQDDCAEGYLLDGFPRTLAQAAAFEEMAAATNRPIDVVINLNISVDQLAPRIVNRRICRNCGEIYNTVFNPSKVEGVCDKCGGELMHRADDNLDSLKVRLDEYDKLTAPVVTYFEEKGLVNQIDAGQTREQVWSDVKEALEKVTND